MNELKNATERIKKKAYTMGFQACGISTADFLAEEKLIMQQWLAARKHGEMAYLERNLDKRCDPRLLVENARSVVSVLLNYFPSQKQSDPEAPIVSKYAFGKDYHLVLKDKLYRLSQFIQEEIAPCSGRVFVDSAPVLERAWAAKAGLGWIGKNTNLISTQYGSFVFIGELIIDLELDPDQQMLLNRCGTCTRCLESCPTGALVEPYVLDARKCISYQTIEKKGEIDPVLKGKLNNRVFGCDICQDVCPWNRKPIPHNEAEFEPPAKLLELKKEEWEQMDKALFDELLKNNAVQRIGYEGLKRNIEAIYSLGDSKSPGE